MEVHHHPQLNHKEKPWKEYLLEGLMIFVAVLMGFIAENIRESIVHNEKERQQIESFVNALKSDSAQLVFVIKANDSIINNLNHFTELRKRVVIDESFKKDFYNYSFTGLLQDIYFKPNDAALEEMKSSGIIGALRKRNIADSIFKYQYNNKAIEQQAADCYYIFKEGFSLLQNTVDMNNYNMVSDNSKTINEKINITDYKPLEIPEDKKVLKNMYSHAASMAAADVLYNYMLRYQLDYNRLLTKFLQKEYHLEKE